MAGSLNKAELIGRVGKGPEVRTTQTGSKIVNLSLATSERWKDRQSGEQKERTEWHRVVIFNDRCANFVEQYVKKGQLLYVTGTIRTRKWTDQSGQDRYSTEIVVEQFGNGNIIDLSVRDAGESGGARSSGSYQQADEQSGFPGGAQPRTQNGSGRGSADPRYGGQRGATAPSTQQHAGPAWDAPGRDLDDEIPF